MKDCIEEIRSQLEGYTPANLGTRLPLLAELLRLHHAARPEVDIERARFVTAHLRKTDETIPMPIRRAQAVSSYLSGRKVPFHDDSMLGGATTGKVLGAPLYPEFFGLSIWPELGSIGDRPDNPQQLSKEEAKILNFEIFPYWMDRSIAEEVRRVDPYRQGLLEKMILFTISKAAAISHTTPAYERLLSRGADAIVAEAADREAGCCRDESKSVFYRSVRHALQGLCTYAANISAAAARKAGTESDPWRKKNLSQIARVCRRVPALPARTYREAVNALWIAQVGVFAENANMAINPGRLDQILYPYFIREYRSGKLSVAEALTITGCLWLKIADNVNLVPQAAERLFGGAGAVPAVTLGGVDQKGGNAVNELTWLLLKITELLPIRDPNVNARYHPGKNPVAYRNEVSRVILSTKAIPAFFNDVENIGTLVNQGESLEHARDYAVIGCVELGSAGRDYSASSSIFMMMYTILYMALHNGRTPVTGSEPLWKATGEVDAFATFEDLWKAYAEQTRLMAANAVALNNTYGRLHQALLPTPLLSALFEGPLEQGRDLIDGGAVYNSSGVTHIGFADVCDSLCAIQDVCFSPQNRAMQLPLPEMVKAVDRNFEGYEALAAYLQHRAPKYGTDHPMAVAMSRRLIDLGYTVFNGQSNYRGGNYRVAYWTMTNHAGYGRVTGALPSGRKAGVPFASGITPASQLETHLTKALDAVAGLDSGQIPGAYALNMKFSPIPPSPENTDRFGSMVEAYMKNGGQQVQFNIQDYHTLEAARKNPGLYPHLLVRVSGYSAYFSSLNEAMQEELILRSQYDLASGGFVALAPPST
jgi:pyruvate formate-lyase/glycerol dehydratase family glycyl radical enzyme